MPRKQNCLVIQKPNVQLSKDLPGVFPKWPGCVTSSPATAATSASSVSSLVLVTLFLIITYCSECEAVSPSGFDLISLTANDIEHRFIVLIGHLYIFLEKYHFRSFIHLLIELPFYC